MVMTDRLEQLLRLQEQEPGDPFCAYAVAMELIKRGEKEEALRWLDKTLELDGGYFYAYYQKGRVLGELGRAEEAQAVLREGIRRAEGASGEAAVKAKREMEQLLGLIGGK